MDKAAFTVGIAKKGSKRGEGVMGVPGVGLVVVPDEELACPGCGAFWGHPDPALDSPNRFKVDDFCRCYNPACSIGYYNPYTGETEAAQELSQEEADKIRAQVEADIALNGMKVTEYTADGRVIDRSIPPTVGPKADQ